MWEAFKDFWFTFDAFLWKNIIIRRRKKLKSLFEVAIVMLIIFVGKLPDKNVITKTDHGKVLSSEDIYNFFDVDSEIYYAPKTSFTSQIMRKFSEKTEIPSDIIHGYLDEADLIKNVNKLNSSYVILYFYDVPDSGITKNLKYYIRIGDDRIDWQLSTLYKSNATFDQTVSDTYINSGFISIMLSVETSFIELACESSNVTMKPFEINFQRFPHPPHVKDQHHIIHSYLQLSIAIIFGCICLSFLHLIAQERSSIQDLLTLNGVSKWIIWTHWFIYALMTDIPATFIASGIIKYFIGVKASFFTIFFFLVLYMKSLLMQSFLISTLFRTGSASLILSTSVHFITYIISNYLYNTDTLLYMEYILPNHALVLGFDLIFHCESFVREVSSFETCHGDPTSSLGQIYFRLFMQFMIFSMLTLYLDSIRSSEQSAGFIKLLRPFQVLAMKCRAPQATEKNIEFSQVDMRYGSYEVFTNLSFKIREGSVTALLGLNGSGKTTIFHILTGVCRPTKGKATTLNRNQLGFCPQKNMNFPHFTVQEHLEFFLKLKCHEKGIDSLKNGIKRLGLWTHKDKITKTLPPGIKRQLNVAIALVGDPEVILLDEPTEHMDVKSTRETWDLLLSKEQSQTVILNTHLTMEADYIADDILIIKSKTEIENVSNANRAIKYYLNLPINSDDQENEISKVTEELEINLEFSEHKAKIMLPDHKNKFELLQKLNDVGIGTDISIYSETLEDIFLKTVTKEETSFENCVPILSEKREKYPPQMAIAIRISILKFLQYRRNWLLFLIHILFPLVIFLFLFLGHNPIVNEQFGMNLTHHTHTEVPYSVSTSNISRFFETIVKSQNSNPNNVSSVPKILLSKAEENVHYFRKYMIVGAEFSQKDEEGISANVMFSTEAYHSLPISLSIITNTLLQYQAGTEYSIATFNNPPKTPDLTKILGRHEVYTKRLIWTFFFPLSNFILVLFYVIIPLKEKTSFLKKQQFLSGVQPYVYWIAHFITDYILYICTLLVLYCPLFLIQKPLITIFDGFDSKAAMFVASLSFGFAGITHGYCFTWFQNKAIGYSMYLLYGLITCTFPVIFNLGDVFSRIFAVIPQFGLNYMGQKIWDKAVDNYEWNHQLDKETMCNRYDNPCCGIDQDACHAYKSFYSAEEGILYPIVIAFFSGIIYIFVVIIANHIRHMISIVPKEFIKGNIITISNKTIAFEPIELHQHECFGVVGRVGSGKTAVNNILHQRSLSKYSTVCILPEKLNFQIFRKNIGWCPQFNTYMSDLTGEEILKLFAFLRGHKPNEVRALLNYLDIVPNRKCKNYSKGNKRKLTFCIAIIGCPNVILLDEPRSGVDRVSRNKFFTLLNTVKKSPSTFISITTQTYLICEKACERFCIMQGGISESVNMLTSDYKDKYQNWKTITIKLRKNMEGELPAIDFNDDAIPLLDSTRRSEKISLAWINREIHKYMEKLKKKNYEVISYEYKMTRFYLISNVNSLYNLFEDMDEIIDEIQFATSDLHVNYTITDTTFNEYMFATDVKENLIS